MYGLRGLQQLCEDSEQLLEFFQKHSALLREVKCVCVRVRAGEEEGAVCSSPTSLS